MTATWRLRVELTDRPGTLARLATSLAARQCNILALTVLPVPDGVIDDIVVSVPSELRPADLVILVRAVGGRCAGITKAEVTELTDAPTAALRAAGRLVDGSAGYAETIRALLTADAAESVVVHKPDAEGPVIHRQAEIRSTGLPIGLGSKRAVAPGEGGGCLAGGDVDHGPIGSGSLVGMASNGVAGGSVGAVADGSVGPAADGSLGPVVSGSVGALVSSATSGLADSVGGSTASGSVGSAASALADSADGSAGSVASGSAELVASGLAVDGSAGSVASDSTTIDSTTSGLGVSGSVGATVGAAANGSVGAQGRGSGGVAANGPVTVLAADGTEIVVRRGWAPFAEVELARAAALANLVQALGTTDARAVVTQDGAGIVLRDGQPADADAVAAMHDRCSRATLFARYHAGTRTIPRRLLHRLLAPPRGRTVLGLVGHQVIAVGQLINTSEPQVGEVSLLVEDDWQGQGVGAALLTHLVRTARAAGHSELFGWCLPGELGLTKAARRAGFPVATRREEDLLRVSLNTIDSSSR